MKTPEEAWEVMGWGASLDVNENDYYGDGDGGPPLVVAVMMIIKAWEIMGGGGWVPDLPFRKR